MKIELTEKVNSSFKFTKNYGNLKDRQKYHKKRQKGISPFIKLDAGDVEKGVEAFNNASTPASNSSSGESSGSGE